MSCRKRLSFYLTAGLSRPQIVAQNQALWVPREKGLPRKGMLVPGRLQRPPKRHPFQPAGTQSPSGVTPGRS